MKEERRIRRFPCLAVCLAGCLSVFVSVCLRDRALLGSGVARLSRQSARRIPSPCRLHNTIPSHAVPVWSRDLYRPQTLEKAFSGLWLRNVLLLIILCDYCGCSLQSLRYISFRLWLAKCDWLWLFALVHVVVSTWTVQETRRKIFKNFFQGDNHQVSSSK